jgi:hypothetical protein
MIDEFSLQIRPEPLQQPMAKEKSGEPIFPAAAVFAR